MVSYLSLGIFSEASSSKGEIAQEEQVNYLHPRFLAGSWLTSKRTGAILHRALAPVFLWSVVTACPSIVLYAPPRIPFVSHFYLDQSLLPPLQQVFFV